MAHSEPPDGQGRPELDLGSAEAVEGPSGDGHRDGLTARPPTTRRGRASVTRPLRSSPRPEPVVDGPDESSEEYRAHLLHTLVVLMSVLTAVALGAVLYAARDVIVPFVFAVFGAYAVEPVVRGLVRLRVPRWAGAFLVVGLLFLVVQLSVGLLAASLDDFETRLPGYLEQVQRLVDSLPGAGTGGAARIPVDDPDFWTDIVPVELVAGFAGTWAGAVTGFIGRALLVLVLLVAMVIARQRFDERLSLVAEKATGHGTESDAILHAIDHGIQRYVQLKTLLSIGNGLVFGLVLALFDADFAFLWAFLAFLLNYIPTIGPVIATVPPVLFLFIQYASEPVVAVVGGTAAAAVPIVVANIVEPKVFGDSLNLNFFAVVFALLLWTFLWGLPGAVLSVPVTLAISLVCREVPALRPIHDLLRN